jgi:predicted RNA methylase
MNIDSAVLDVLSNAIAKGNSLKLAGQLERKLYLATNKVLEAAGGKWDRQAQAHLFDSDAAEIMDQIVLTGKVLNKKQELGFFPTPPAVVAHLLELAQIEDGDSVLEPSAGTGAILGEIRRRFPRNRLTAVEIDESRTELVNMAQRVHYGDFLDLHPVSLETGTYHRIVMNPPFARQADIHHVLHALTSFLKPGGRLVSVMSASVAFRTNTLTVAFRETVAQHGGTIEALPENAFTESGTHVNAVIVTMEELKAA